ncbi:ABC transporter ATP-binding protein [Komagataeibacter sucrofermentans]|uniref:Nitrate/sulfonate/bicarbonate ABC transporter ATP-binding protein n=1 Tax=Komagataeibacter sucrofermentans TaxID=1053551 RepID=A0A318QPV1_9PROT|nr:ATP-binding cassette domain-containing protein [Komagataeibacter sucrofermentans]PYD79498.1 nitrate/sulfonate/bicarbonate ABC transporter ATP-binding protein [Komagataeibacter sucrofermentans]GBQ46683.1 ABC transporter aliphatic sulfonates transporter ATP-binding protein [Komagataeibacter sucrofermentans DSM 15973]
MTPPPPGIRLEGVGLDFGNAPLFRGLDLLVAAGHMTVLLGASGVGKTSLLRMIGGLAVPDYGRIVADDGLPLAGRVAWMGQQDLLLPWASVLDNVTLGARLRGERADLARARHLLGCVGLADQAAALPAALSGGMRQRAALARVLYENRPVVLMDEPFSALDSITRARMQDLAGRMLAERTVVLITHDPLEACRLADTMLLMAGNPATMSRLDVPGGTVPRPVDAPAVLRAQASLLRRMMQ